MDPPIAAIASTSSDEVLARPEPRRHALLYLQAVLSEIPRKNSWQVAEHARQGRPYGMQRLLSRGVWDEDGVRDDLRAYVLEQLGTADGAGAIAVLDESGFRHPRHQVSWGQQTALWRDRTRGELPSRSLVFAMSPQRGTRFLDRDLYLPEDWLNDRKRCREAGKASSVQCPSQMGIGSAHA